MSDQTIPSVIPSARESRATILCIRGRRYQVGHVPLGKAARRVQGGPEVPGPWAYIYELASVIHRDPRLGTSAENEAAKAEGRWLALEIGDRIRIGEEVYRLEQDRQRRLRLELLDSRSPRGARTMREAGWSRSPTGWLHGPSGFSLARVVDVWVLLTPDGRRVGRPSVKAGTAWQTLDQAAAWAEKRLAPSVLLMEEPLEIRSGWALKLYPEDLELWTAAGFDTADLLEVSE